MKNQKGFSLLEVVIGLVILAVGLLGVAGMTTTSVRVNGQANHLTEAGQSAQAEMEKLRILPWASLVNGSSTTTSKTEKVFTNSWTVTTTGNLKDLILVTFWTDGVDAENQPITHSVEFRTKIAR